MRRCTACGYTWPLPHKGHAKSNLFEGADLRAYPYQEVRLVREHVAADAEDSIEVREDLSHCPQCGSGHLTKYREDEHSKEHVTAITRRHLAHRDAASWLRAGPVRPRTDNPPGEWVRTWLSKPSHARTTKPQPLVSSCQMDDAIAKFLRHGDR